MGKYKDMFLPSNSIWALVEQNLGKQVAFTQQDTNDLSGEMTVAKEENKALALGFNCSETLIVISVQEGTVAAEAGVKPNDKIIEIPSRKDLGKVMDRNNKEKMQGFLEELKNPTVWPLIVTFAPLEEGLVKYEIVGAFEDYPFEEVLNYFPWVPKFEVLEDENGQYTRLCEIRRDYEVDGEDVDEWGRKANKERDTNDMGEDTYGWGEEIEAGEVSRLIPEAFQDKFKFPNHNAFLVLDKNLHFLVGQFYTSSCTDS